MPCRRHRPRCRRLRGRSSLKPHCMRELGTSTSPQSSPTGISVETGQRRRAKSMNVDHAAIVLKWTYQLSKIMNLDDSNCRWPRLSISPPTSSCSCHQGSETAVKIGMITDSLANLPFEALLTTSARLELDMVE